MHKRFLATLLPALAVSLPTHGALLAYYSFDSDFTDGSGQGNDLSIGGSDPAITLTNIAFGSGALDLDGDDWLSMATTLNFGASDAWSVAFWGRRGAGAAAQDGMIIGEAGSSGNFIWTPDNASVVQGLRFRNSSGTSSDFGGIPDDGQYHHWAVIADGTGDVSVYRDNSLLGTQTPGGGTVFTANAVGQAFSAAGQIYLGQLDELYVFDEAIDSTTVDSLFNSNQIPEPGSIALLTFGGLFSLRRRR